MDNVQQNLVASLLDKMQDDDTWRKTWKSFTGLNQNLVTKNIYSGTNQIFCYLASEKFGFTSPHWLTYRQATGEFGIDMKGIKSPVRIRYFEMAENKETGDTYPSTKWYPLWNLDQFDYQFDVPTTQQRVSNIENPQEFAQIIGVPVIFGPHKTPCFIPSKKIIEMPPAEQFEDDSKYQSGLLHEVGHATGPILGRDMSGKFGSESYAKEELCAELFSIFMCAQLGIEYDLTNHASYLRHWQKAIKSNSNYLFNAASDASKACNYVMTQFEMSRKYDEEAA